MLQACIWTHHDDGFSKQIYSPLDGDCNKTVGIRLTINPGKIVPRFSEAGIFLTACAFIGVKRL